MHEPSDKTASFQEDSTSSRSSGVWRDGQCRRSERSPALALDGIVASSCGPSDAASSLAQVKRRGFEAAAGVSSHLGRRLQGLSGWNALRFHTWSPSVGTIEIMSSP
jgi:hypothetical protein